MNSIKPKKFLEYAELNLNEINKDNQERILINTYGCIAKALHSQVDELIKYISVLKKPKKKLENFRARLDFILDSGLFAPTQINELNRMRYKLEHEYEVPTQGEIRLAISNLHYFIREAQRFMETPVIEVKGAIEEYMSKVEKKIREISKSESTWESYLLQAKKFFYHYGKDPYLLTNEDANRYLKKIIDEKYPASHIQHVEAILKFIYLKVLDKPYKLEVKRPSIHRKELPILNDDEIKDLLKIVPNVRERLYIRLTRSTGMKVSNLTNLKISEIPKLKLNDEDLNELKEYIGKRKEGYVFLNKYGDKLSIREIHRFFLALSKKINKRITTEILRKSNPYIRHKNQITMKRGRMPQCVLREDEVITQKEFKLLLKNAETELKRYYLYFVYYFGMGLNQFMNLRLGDINFKNNIIKTKPMKHFMFDHVEITKPVGNMIKKYCEEYKIKEGKLFYYVDTSVRLMIQNAGRKAGIDEKKLGYGVLSNSLKFSKIYGIK